MSSDRAMTLRDQPYGHFTGAPIEVPVDPLLRLQGYRDMARIRPRVRAIATKVAALAETLVAPETTYRRVRIGSCTPAALALETGAETGAETGVTFHSAEFAKVLGGCGEIVVFVLTLGAGFDAEAERLTANEEIVEALFMEMAGWIAVERATKDFAGHLGSLVRGEDLAPTRRLGPGYVDWPLEEQAALFALLDGAPLPVRLLDSCAMVPRKSRSGLYGLRPLD